MKKLVKRQIRNQTSIEAYALRCLCGVCSFRPESNYLSGGGK
ncbi:putative bacteriocin precursor%2C CLI_3235 family [uncultured Clostridium sp.]|nr:putative bacteriocin precursor%2C CLI_3235 family [uncultured Clostridium sp.]